MHFVYSSITEARQDYGNVRREQRDVKRVDKVDDEL
jgi:hypothetical protein